MDIAAFEGVWKAYDLHLDVDRSACSTYEQSESVDVKTESLATWKPGNVNHLPGESRLTHTQPCSLGFDTSTFLMGASWGLCQTEVSIGTNSTSHERTKWCEIDTVSHSPQLDYSKPARTRNT